MVLQSLQSDLNAQQLRTKHAGSFLYTPHYHQLCSPGLYPAISSTTTPPTQHKIISGQSEKWHIQQNGIWPWLHIIRLVAHKWQWNYERLLRLACWYINQWNLCRYFNEYILTYGTLMPLNFAIFFITHVTILLILIYNYVTDGHRYTAILYMVTVLDKGKYKHKHDTDDDHVRSKYVWILCVPPKQFQLECVVNLSYITQIVCQRNNTEYYACFHSCTTTFMTTKHNKWKHNMWNVKRFSFHSLTITREMPNSLVKGMKTKSQFHGHVQMWKCTVAVLKLSLKVHNFPPSLRHIHALSYILRPKQYPNDLLNGSLLT